MSQAQLQETEHLTVVETKRQSNKTVFAQYFTPPSVAKFMADMFEPLPTQQLNVLDPGAGEGILGIALVNKLLDTNKNVPATFIEIDKQVFDVLNSRVKDNAVNAKANLVNESFISYGVKLRNNGDNFSHIIINPPYFKIRTDSSQAKFLQQNGIHATNIYSAFVWLSAQLLSSNGQLTAIIPRSFCNGPYFTKFRHYLLNNFSLDSIHIFSSRDSVFSGDSVLQENVIIKISKREQESQVKVTYSTNQNFNDVEQKLCPIEHVILKNDPDMVIHIPHREEQNSLDECVSSTLSDLELQVSTGSVVDFRLEDRISPVAQDGAVPLLYPAHVSSGEMIWPLQDLKKRGQYYIPVTDSQIAIESLKANTDTNVLPSDGYYVVVRRFSSKEEQRRIFASVVCPQAYSETGIAFENHLNYYHVNRHGFEKEAAYGLAAYLNSQILDDYFRRFSGHTQVNVSDLKKIPYPSLSVLCDLGRAVTNGDKPIDELVNQTILGDSDDN